MFFVGAGKEDPEKRFLCTILCMDIDESSLIIAATFLLVTCQQLAKTADETQSSNRWLMWVERQRKDPNLPKVSSRITCEGVQCGGLFRRLLFEGTQKTAIKVQWLEER